MSQLLHPDENPQDSPPSECTTCFQSPLQPLKIWARGNGTVHFGFSGQRANPSLFLPHGCVVFLHQEEGWVPAFVHWLLGFNKITIRNKYPLPLIDAVFSPLPKARIFNKLNLWNVYHLVQSRRRHKFNTSLGYFESLVMRLWSTNAPAVFQALVNNVLQDMLNRFLFVYIDDILSETLEEHIQHFWLVLQRLRENCLLKLKTINTIYYANYQRFIQNYYKVATPLTGLTSTSNLFVPTKQRPHSFVSSPRSPQLPFWSVRTSTSNSLWRWMPRGRCMTCCNMETGNSWLLCLHCRSGHIGWRDQFSRSWSGLTTRTLLSSAWPSSWTLNRQSGRASLGVSIPPLPIGKWSLMPCPASSLQTPPAQILVRSCWQQLQQPPGWWRRWSGGHSWLILALLRHLTTGCLFRNRLNLTSFSGGTLQCWLVTLVSSGTVLQPVSSILSRFPGHISMAFFYGPPSFWWKCHHPQVSTSPPLKRTGLSRVSAHVCTFLGRTCTLKILLINISHFTSCLHSGFHPHVLVTFSTGIVISCSLFSVYTKLTLSPPPFFYIVLYWNNFFETSLLLSQRSAWCHLKTAAVATYAWAIKSFFFRKKFRMMFIGCTGWHLKKEEELQWLAYGKMTQFFSTLGDCSHKCHSAL